MKALQAEREFVMTPKSFMHNINRICLDNVRPASLPCWNPSDGCYIPDQTFVHACTAQQARLQQAHHAETNSCELVWHHQHKFWR